MLRQNSDGEQAVAAKGAPTAKLACLDGLRGVAILLVVFFHLPLVGAEDLNSATISFCAPFSYGFSGVHLFLVLSGFCLTHSLISRTRAGRSPSLRSYLGARWWRIAPPYYAAIALYFIVPLLYLAIGRHHPGIFELNRKQILTHVLFIHGYWVDTIYAINIPFWSLSLEFQFYLVFPLLFALSLRFGVVRVLLVVAAMSVAWRFWVASMLPDSFHMAQMIHGIFLGRWTEFALGMAVAFWYSEPDRVADRRWPWGTMALVCLVMAIVATRTKHPFAYDFFYGVGFASLLAATLVSSHRGGALARLMSTPWLVTIGVVSYSLYLTHSFFQTRGFQVYRQFVKTPTVLTDTIALTAITIAVAVGGWYFHQYVERRFLKAPKLPKLPAVASRPSPVSTHNESLPSTSGIDSRELPIPGPA